MPIIATLILHSLSCKVLGFLWFALPLFSCTSDPADSFISLSSIIVTLSVPSLDSSLLALDLPWWTPSLTDLDTAMSLSQSGNKNYHWVFREWIYHRELVVRREDPCKRMLPGLVLGSRRNRLSLSEVRSSQKWGSDLWKGKGEASSHCLEEATCWEEQLGWEKLLLLEDAAPGGSVLTEHQANRTKEAASRPPVCQAPAGAFFWII